MSEKLELIAQVGSKIRKITGLTPDTSNYIPALNRMLDRGVQPGAVHRAVDSALSSEYHRERFIDGGLRYIESHFHQLLSLGNSGIKTKMSSGFDPNKRRRWEVALHEYEHKFQREFGREPVKKERDFECAKFIMNCQQVQGDAEELVDYWCADCHWGVVPEGVSLLPRAKPQQVVFMPDELQDAFA